MTRRYGRAPRGHWKVMTLAAAVRLGGVGGCLVLDGAIDAMAFETYVERCLAPALRPGDVVVMDNLSSHKRGPVADAIEAVGAAVRYLPPYSPDLDPIEKMFSKLKEYLRSAGRRTIPELIGAIGDGPRTVTDRDITGWSRSCGNRYGQA
jgi:transposase